MKTMSKFYATAIAGLEGYIEEEEDDIRLGEGIAKVGEYTFAIQEDGEVVNDAVPTSQCTEEAHAVKWHSRQKYCVEVWRSARPRRMSGGCGNP